MIISDALPVQFWAIDCETYNERQVCGIYNRCYCQPFQADDQINLQFTDDADIDYTLDIIDADGNLLWSNYFDASEGVYSLSFVPEVIGITNQQIQLKIVQDASPEAEVYKSDCLDIKVSHPCTNLISYFNNRDYAGLVYADQSPDVEFFLRVPSVFFHERQPETDKSLELSNSTIINLSGTIKSQRKLEIDSIPDYFHKKIQLALRHHTVEIDRLLWIREEPYEKVEPQNKRWPIKQASVWLTQRNFVVRNIV